MKSKRLTRNELFYQPGCVAGGCVASGKNLNSSPPSLSTSSRLTDSIFHNAALSLRIGILLLAPRTRTGRSTTGVEGAVAVAHSTLIGRSLLIFCPLYPVSIVRPVTCQDTIRIHTKFEYQVCRIDYDLDFKCHCEIMAGTRSPKAFVLLNKLRIIHLG